MSRKPRIDKKLHRHWLERSIIDLSQNTYWREKLFNAEREHDFPINADNCKGLPLETSDALKKFGLEYVVSKVSNQQVDDDWLVGTDLVVFEFRALKYPKIKIQTANNPEVI